MSLPRNPPANSTHWSSPYPCLTPIWNQYFKSSIQYPVFSHPSVLSTLLFSHHNPYVSIQYLIFSILNSLLRKKLFSVPPQGACLFLSRHVIIQSNWVPVEFRAVDVCPGMPVITEECQKCVSCWVGLLHVVGGVEHPRQGAEQQDSCAVRAIFCGGSSLQIWWILDMWYVWLCLQVT